jgi:hypothetical protein
MSDGGPDVDLLPLVLIHLQMNEVVRAASSTRKIR